MRTGKQKAPQRIIIPAKRLIENNVEPAFIKLHYLLINLANHLVTYHGVHITQLTHMG